MMQTAPIMARFWMVFNSRDFTIGETIHGQTSTCLASGCVQQAGLQHSMEPNCTEHMTRPTRSGQRTTAKHRGDTIWAMAAHTRSSCTT